MRIGGLGRNLAVVLEGSPVSAPAAALGEEVEPETRLLGVEPEPLVACVRQDTVNRGLSASKPVFVVGMPDDENVDRVNATSGQNMAEVQVTGGRAAWRHTCSVEAAHLLLSESQGRPTRALGALLLLACHRLKLVTAFLEEIRAVEVGQSHRDLLRVGRELIEHHDFIDLCLAWLEAVDEKRARSRP
jgi:hypothetical protein